MNNNITVTLPLNQFEEMKKSAEENHIKNFISIEYRDIQSNDAKLVLNYENIERRYGMRVNQLLKTVIYDNSSRNVSAVINNGIMEIIQTFGGKVEEIIPLGVEEVKMILNLLNEWEEHD